MNVLLSIKPEFSEKILSREKQYEFRKTRFQEPATIDTVYMYASSPVQRIVGSFTLDRVIEDQPDALWRRCGDQSGIQDRSRFMEYFSGKETGYAIKIEESHRLSRPLDPRQYIEDFRPPVSFQYIQEDYDFLMDNQTCVVGSD